MYIISELEKKDLTELQTIAKELGLKGISKIKKEDLIYKIIDEQAVATASQKAEKAPAKKKAAAMFSLRSLSRLQTERTRNRSSSAF